MMEKSIPKHPSGDDLNFSSYGGKPYSLYLEIRFSTTIQEHLDSIIYYVLDYSMIDYQNP